MTINLADNSPRVSYSVASGVTQTSFAVPFEFFADADLNVYVNGVLKTLTTNYTVAGGDGSTGTITMADRLLFSHAAFHLNEPLTSQRLAPFRLML